MARRLRIQFSGAIYHVINRGNYRRDLFATRGAARSFEHTLGEACVRHGWLVHAFATMRNHFHVALTTPHPNLTEGMHWLQTTFALRFNRFRSESGHLFQGRYQSPLIEDAPALVRVVDYIHLNPVGAGVARDPAAFQFGSLARFVHGPRPVWLSAQPWLDALQLDDSPAGWRDYVERLTALGSNPSDEQRQDVADISRGRPIGTDAWRRALANDHRHRALEQDLPSDETLPLKEARWEAALSDVLERLGHSLNDITPTRRAPRWKIAAASLLRQTSGAPYRWIAEKLRLGTAGSIRAAVHRASRVQPN